MADPSCCEDNHNSTCPSKFRQHQSWEVSSRWVELSVERTNGSFLSVSQRSTSWRYSLCMAKGEKSVARFSCELACKAYERLFFTCRMQLRRKNCNLRRYDELLSKNMLVALCENKGEKTIETSVSIWRGFSLLFNHGFFLLLVVFEKFRCFWRGNHCKEGM